MNTSNSRIVQTINLSPGHKRYKGADIEYVPRFLRQEETNVLLRKISENQRTDLFLKLLKILLLHHQLMVWLFMLINLEVMEIL